MATLLQITQEFCKRRGLPTPTAVAASQDDTTLQIWGLLNEGSQEIADRYEWQFLTTRYTFIHAASTAYTALDLSDSGPVPDYKAMLNRTLWDTNGRREVNGPLSSKEWEVLLNLAVSQAVYNYRIFGNALRIYPVPTVPADVTFAMEYISKYGVYSPTAAANQESFVLDTDICRLPTNVILADIKWRWAYNKGLPYAEDFRACEALLVNLQGRDPAPDIVMDSSGYEQVAAPGLLVAAGSWNLP